MKIYKSELRTMKILDKEMCDWCGIEIVVDDSHTLSNDIKMKRAYSDYGDYWVEWGWECSFCEDCIEKLKVLLLKSGINIREVDD